MVSPKLYTGKNLSGSWLFTRKLDGVRMLRDENNNPVSRANKPLYNLHEIPDHITDAEIFVESWETTVSMVRTREGEAVSSYAAYSLDPLDPRLVLYWTKDPTAEFIAQELAKALDRGDEGLVIYGHKVFKVKPKENYDVPVTGATEGKGKYAGLIGALITPLGKVSGMNDEQRKAFTKKLPEIIEVSCMGLTKGGKFRHPYFVRERFDKPIQECAGV